MERQAQERGLLWPEYVGEGEAAPAYVAGCCARENTRGHAARGSAGFQPASDDWAAAAAAECTHWLRHVYNPERWRKCAYDPSDHLPVDEAETQGRTTTWQALWDDRAVYLRVACRGEGGSLQVLVEPCRTQPRRILFVSADGSARAQQDDGYRPRAQGNWEATVEADEGEWTATVTLPWEWLGQKPGRRPKPFRLNILRHLPISAPPGGAECSWTKREPAKGRLVWGDLNPATDFGWLRFEN